MAWSLNEQLLNFSRSPDGKTFTAPIAISPTAATSFPQIGISPSDQIDVVFGASTGLLFSSSSDHGQTFSPAINTNGAAVNPPQMVVDACNNLDLTFDFSPAQGQQLNIFADFLTSGAASFSTPVNLGNTPNIEDFYPRMAADLRGNAYVVWEADTQNSPLYFVQIAAACK